ncbi:restriction endonuclease subunit S [Mycobacterium sp. SMC-11]|uniref:restriction endonuclease subunit S n=1 Tax=Mycobacterium sp. SMC-11 TaxID=3385969 RepID=UPI00390C680F
MRRVALGEVVDLRAGIGFPPALQGRKSGEYPFAKVGDISRHGRNGALYIDTADNFVNDADLAALKSKPIPPGSTLFAKIGEAIRQNHRVIVARPMLVDNNAMAATPTSQVDSGYLFRFLQSVDLYRYATSTTVPSLRKSDLERIELPLPPLYEQRRIAAILDQADALRVKRREMIAQLDELARSIFLEMFGDLRPSITLGECADIQGGLQVTSKRQGLPLALPYLRVANVYRGRLELTQVKSINVTESEAARTRLERDDLLFVEGHANPDEVGRVAVWDGSIVSCLHQNHLIRVRLHDGVLLPQFAESWFNSRLGACHFRRAGKTTSGLNTISANVVRSAPIPAPSLSQQRSFNGRVERIRSEVRVCRKSLSALDALFASLQSRAFRGEL